MKQISPLRLRLFRAFSLVLLLVSGATTPAWSQPTEKEVVEKIAKQTALWLDTLSPEQQQQAVLPYDSENRTDWHYVPKRTRKGVKLRDMTEAQREQAYQVLAVCLNEDRYQKARRVMDLEKIIEQQEKPVGDWRDYMKYYYTVFGDPRKSARWGLSIEGHHLSLNYVFENGQILSSTPQFFAANPAIVPEENSFGIEVKSQVLKLEQNLALELLDSLTPEQKSVAIFADKTPRDVHNAAKPHPPLEAPRGLSAKDMNDSQKDLLRRLILSYTEALPEPVSARRWKDLEASGLEQIHFAWAGGTKLGEAHYYRIQGDRVYIEFINHQRDSYGNPNNHIHSLLRDMQGDFALPAR